MNKQEVIDRISREFPSIHIDLIQHDAFGREFQVRCFGVEASLSRTVRRKIITISREMFPDCEANLIPLIFTKKCAEERDSEVVMSTGMNKSCCGPIDPIVFLEGVLPRFPKLKTASFFELVEYEQPYVALPKKATTAYWYDENDAPRFAVNNEYALAA